MNELWDAIGSYQDISLIKLLIAAGEDVNDVGPDGLTPLILASIMAQETTAGFLIESGASVNIKDDIGYTALHYVVHSDDVNLAKILLDNGADVNATGNTGETPLLCALKYYDEYDDMIKYKNRSIIELLLQYGANANLEDDNGVSPNQIVQEMRRLLELFD
jgi:ankyrin repeat protein